MSILAVPLEIRQVVYSYLLLTNEGLKPWERGVPRSRRAKYDLHPAILRTCRQIYHEAYSFLLSNNVFERQTVFSCTYTTYSLFSGDNDLYPKKSSYHLHNYQAPGIPHRLSDFARLDLIRHLDLKCSNGFERPDLLESFLSVALRCLLRTLRVELWCDWHQDQLAEPLDALMRLEVSDLISITVFGRAPGQLDLTIRTVDRMLASGQDGWLYDVKSANLDVRSYPFLPKHGSQAGEWVLVPRKAQAVGIVSHLSNA